MANRHKFKRGGAAKQTSQEHEREVESEGGLKRGGRAFKGGGKVPGFKRGGRFARGGKVGADKHPFSSAYTASTEAK